MERELFGQLVLGALLVFFVVFYFRVRNELERWFTCERDLGEVQGFHVEIVRDERSRHWVGLMVDGTDGVERSVISAAQARELAALLRAAVKR